MKWNPFSNLIISLYILSFKNDRLHLRPEFVIFFCPSFIANMEHHPHIVELNK